MFEADPDFAMGHIMTLGLQCFVKLGTTPSAEVRKKLSRFSDQPKKAKLTSHELMHLTAANQMAEEVILFKKLRHYMLVLGLQRCDA